MRFGVLLLVCGLAACDEPEPIRIGFLGEMSGRNADLGVSSLNGAMIAIEEQNLAGGLNGRPIHIVVRDDTMNPALAVKYLDDFAAASIEVVIGPVISNMVVAIAPAAAARNLLLISPGAKTRRLTGLDDNVIRMVSDTSLNAVSMATFLAERRDIHRVVIIRDGSNDEFTKDWSDDFTARFGQLKRSVDREIVYESGGRAHFHDLAKQAVMAKSDAIVLIAGNLDAAILCQHIRNFDPDVVIATSEWAGSDKFIEAGGRATEGVLLSQNINSESDDPAYLTFVQKYRSKYKSDPGLIGIRAYEAAQTIFTALKLRQDDESIKEAILRIGTFPGMQNPVQIDRFGDSARPPFISEVSGGKLTVVGR
ncbi:ABC transporter substrate-binding protein [Magnetospirillum fulvum]|uniref:ABC transporter substrate-binding protein n=1 Tax=Magnetospirillum fulvum TaxID=1082 RepID=UPI0011153091|nr:ABC transporter substrate-binding protein [Magnetospirillum fulvum]